PLRMLYDSATWIKRGIEGRRRGGFESYAPPPDRAAELFLNALVHAPHQDLTRLRLVVTDPDADDRFIRALDRQHGDQRYPPYIRGLGIADVSGLLTAAGHSVMDDPRTAGGHELIAAALIAALR